MLVSTGVPSQEDIEKVFPDSVRLSRGAVAVIECFQDIPCNPCYTACNRNAIKEFQDINDLPTIDHGLCNGCGLCISKCPGLAIMVVDMTYSDHEALLKIPYEFIPLPSEGTIVKGLDRYGEYVSDVTVIKVLHTKALDRTPIVSIAIPKEYIHTIRNIGMGD
jgi:Fe-S-cluster-containing hydrogenase component 2